MGEKVRGKRAFVAGAIGLIVMGSLHALVVASAIFGQPQDDAEAAYRRAAREVRLKVGPLESDAWGGTQILSASYSLLLVHVGLLNLLVLRPMIAQGRLRRLTALNVLFMGLHLAVAVAFQFLPPIVFALFVLLMFAISLAQQSRANPSPTRTASQGKP